MDLTCALRLEENTGICFMGPSPKAPFDLTADVANKMLAEPLNVNGRPNSDVVRPLASGIDLVQRPRNMWTIDFAMMALSAAEQYEAPFEYINRVVYPVRIQGSRVKYAGDWWQYARPRPAMRAVLAGKSRFFATPEVAKHRIFVWLDARVLSNQQTLVYAREDDYFFGVLHSRVHELWALRMGTQLREFESGFRYTPTTCFETFPFPWPPGSEPAEDADVRVAAIAAAARELVRLREGWLNPPGAGEAELKTRTLTNLYNQRPAWLANLHARLDAAVLDAYGWPHDLADEELLARLLALNAERAGAALTPPAPLSHTQEA